MRETKHTPGPWSIGPVRKQNYGGGIVHHDHLIQVGEGAMAGNCFASVSLGGPGATDCREKSVRANAQLIIAAPELLEAVRVQHECGEPEKVSLYDEEGVEGWKWAHPDGREWQEIGDWNEPPPMHPMARAAIDKATGATHPDGSNRTV